LRECALDRLDRSLDARAISTRRREQDPLDHEPNVAALRPETSRLNRNINPGLRRRSVRRWAAAARRRAVAKRVQLRTETKKERSAARGVVAADPLNCSPQAAKNGPTVRIAQWERR
jgi:hypothetical protein